MTQLPIFIVSVVALQLVLAEDPKFDAHWEHFKVKYGKDYESDHHENASRKSFEKTVKHIAEHNLRHVLGMENYAKAVHEFADQDPKHVIQRLCKSVPPNNFTVPESRRREFSSRANPPDSVDYENGPRVTSIKNQGNCGSCWSFSAAGAIEGQLLPNNYPVRSLSEKQLVDCDTKNHGCDGGWMTTAFEHVKNCGGIQLYDDYPYVEEVGNCRFNQSKVYAQVVDWRYVKANEETVAKALYEVGPLAAAICVRDEFLSYNSGIYTDKKCKCQVNHAILIVGYGKENGKDYWKIKNSWGSNWGEKGYARMARNARNQCSIASYACYPVLAKKA